MTDSPALVDHPEGVEFMPPKVRANEIAKPAPGRKSGSLWRSAVPVWVLTGIGVVGLVVGFVAGSLVQSPEEADVPPPVEGLITARVEAREITATVVARADVGFVNGVEVDPAIPEGASAAVVTGQVPQVGAEVNAGNVILEVSGTPVFVLAGSFPAYRSIGPGSSGADVVQLRAALAGLGLDAGQAGANTYDEALAHAVDSLYERAGYPAPGSNDPTKAQAVRAARDGVTDAQTGVEQAENRVTQAQNAAGRAVDSQAQAQRDYDAAVAAQNTVPTTDPAITEQPPSATMSVAQARLALDQATANVEQANTAIGQAQDGLTQAERVLARANESLADVERSAWSTMPIGAMVFVTDLPLRVDQVNVRVGDDLAALAGSATGPNQDKPAAVVLSGGEISVTASVSVAEGALLTVDGPAVLTVSGLGDVTGKIVEICEAASSGGPVESAGSNTTQLDLCPVEIVLTDLGEVSRTELVGNHQVTMVVGTSAADSLIVPVAAVSADTAGRARITVVEGALEPGVAARDQETMEVQVTTGLSAQGMVEIVRASPAIKEGDLVVIGQVSGQPAPTAEPTEGG